MAEFVVYQDSPLAEYLESIDSNEIPVPLPLHTHTPHTKPVFEKISHALYQYWKRSVFHDTFSVSLPIAEEVAFEEKFKYLIVTSPLLNEILSVHTKQHLKQEPSFSFSSNRPRNHAGTLATLAGFCMAFGVERWVRPRPPRWSSIPLPMPMTSTAAIPVSLFFVYRHGKRSSIRQSYQTALSRLQTLVEECHRLDTRIHRAINTIQEVELVSRGYRLSTPLSPISRIEQTSKSRHCMALRQRLVGLLRKAFMVYEEAIMDLSDLVNKPVVARFYDMYNVRSIASLSAVSHRESEESLLSLEYIRELAQLMHAKRRECMIHFLSLSSATEAHDSLHRHYENEWHAVNKVLNTLASETKAFTVETKEAVDQELNRSSAHKAPEASSSPVAEGQLRQFVHRLAMLDQHIRTLEAKLYLCHDDVRQMSAGSDADRSSGEHLLREYQSLQQDIQYMTAEWALGKQALEQFLSPTPIATYSEPSSSSSEVSEVDEKDKEEQKHGDIVTSEEVSDLSHVLMPTSSYVLEAVVETRPGAMEYSKKSRQERIQDMKKKREDEILATLAKVDSQTMVHELKSVLDRRFVEIEREK